MPRRYAGGVANLCLAIFCRQYATAVISAIDLGASVLERASVDGQGACCIEIAYDWSVSYTGERSGVDGHCSIRANGMPGRFAGDIANLCIAAFCRPYTTAVIRTVDLRANVPISSSVDGQGAGSAIVVYDTNVSCADKRSGFNGHVSIRTNGLPGRFAGDVANLCIAAFC